MYRNDKRHIDGHANRFEILHRVIRHFGSVREPYNEATRSAQQKRVTVRIRLRTQGMSYGRSRATTIINYNRLSELLA